MSVVKAPMHTAMPPIVHVLRPPQLRVLPPDDWALDGKFGHMAFEAGDSGRLVRLADVLRWLQASRALPRSEALKLLCDGMPAEVMGWLNRLQPDDYAIAVSSNYAFNYETAEQIAARQFQDRQNAIRKGLELERSYGRFGVPVAVVGGRVSFGYPEPTEPGLPALLKRLQSWRGQTKLIRGATCDVLDDPRSMLTTLAIPLDKAHVFWVYGTVVTAPLSAETQPASKEWTGERLAAHRAVFEADGKAAPMKRLAAFTGLSDRKIRRLIEAVEAPKTDAKLNSVWSRQVIKKR